MKEHNVNCKENETIVVQGAVINPDDLVFKENGSELRRL